MKLRQPSTESGKTRARSQDFAVRAKAFHRKELKMKNKKIRPWMMEAAKSIVKNVAQFHDDYATYPAAVDVAQEIADFHYHPRRKRRSRKVQ